MLSYTAWKATAEQAGRVLKVGVRRPLVGVTSALVMAVGMLSVPTQAHHSFAMFDMSKQAEFSGTVKSFLWTNPHSLLIVSGDQGGKTVDFNVEMNGPGYLVRNGWKRDSLKSGDKVTVTVHPLRDGTPGGDLVKVVFPDGRALSAQITLPPGTKLPPGFGGDDKGDKK